MKSLPTVVIIGALCVLLHLPSALAVTFTDVTHQANLDNYPSCRASAWFDYDRDGFLDLLIGSEVGSNRLHRNLGDGTFINVTAQANIPHRSGVWGVNFADINNDWYQEIYLSTRAPDTVSAGRNVLLYNTGQGSFNDISDSSHANVFGGGIAACFAPFSKGPYVDLFAPNQYYPDVEYPNFLSNSGDGSFSDRTEELGLHSLDWWDVPIAFDYDNDFELELFCTKDYHGNSMYDRLAGYEFIDVSDSLDFQTPCGYGATIGDVNNDGWFDLYITNWHQYGDNLFIFNPLSRRYSDRTQQWTCYGAPWTSATHFADFDNDGWLDLFITGAGTGNRYYHNLLGEGFSDQTSEAELSNYNYNWGASIADYDKDGFLDIFVPEYYQGNGGKLYHNNGNNNHWVEFELEGRHSNRDGIGTKLILESPGSHQIRQVIAGSGFGSQNSLIQHFGLGQDSIINRLTIYWPGSGYDIYDSISVNRIYHVVEGEALSIDNEPTHLPTEFGIVTAYPNPFNNHLLFEIYIGRTCALTVDIVDILGRKIITLLTGKIEPKTLIIPWDGRDQSGEPVGSGIYFCRVSDGTRQETTKITLLK